MTVRQRTLAVFRISVLVKYSGPFSVSFVTVLFLFWHCWLGIRKSIRPVKIEWWGVGVVLCLEPGADCLHVVQLMPLHPKTPSSLDSFKSGLVLLFWYRLAQVVQEKRPSGVASVDAALSVVCRNFVYFYTGLRAYCVCVMILGFWDNHTWAVDAEMGSDKHHPTHGCSACWCYRPVGTSDRWLMVTLFVG